MLTDKEKEDLAKYLVKRDKHISLTLDMARQQVEYITMFLSKRKK